MNKNERNSSLPSNIKKMFPLFDRTCKDNFEIKRLFLDAHKHSVKYLKERTTQKMNVDIESSEEVELIA